MKPFSFRLEKVFRYRAHLEKKVHLQFCEAAKKVKEHETRIAQLGDTRVDAAGRLADERAKGIFVCRDHIHGSFIQGLADRIAEQGRDLDKSLEKLERLRSLLYVAATKKRSLESLKDVQFARFNEEREKMEQKLLDDLVLMIRKRGET